MLYNLLECYYPSPEHPGMSCNFFQSNAAKEDTIMAETANKERLVMRLLRIVLPFPSKTQTFEISVAILNPLSYENCL